MGAVPVGYKWRNASDQQQPDMDLGMLYANQGYGGLKRFIMDEAFTDMIIHQSNQSSNYRSYYESTQPLYASFWHGAKEELLNRFKHDPRLKSKIENEDF